MSNKALEKATARTEMTNKIRDLLTLKIKMPLGNPNLKLLHTNQCVYTKLPASMTLANLQAIAKSINSTYNRFEQYELNRWYVENTTITNDGSNFTIELSLNPFASSIKQYKDDAQSLRKAYIDAKSSKSKTKTNTGTVASTGSVNTTLKGGQGTFIDDLVKKIVGNETDDLKKAKAIHNHLQPRLNYNRYCCGKYGTDAEKAYKDGNLNCGDTALVTTAMMRSAGLDADVVWSPGHFWTRIRINGKDYFSDCTDKGRNWNEVWKGMSYESVKGQWCGCESYPC